MYWIGLQQTTKPVQVPGSVEAFLKEMGLARYWAKFEETGFDMLDTLEDLNESVLNAMNVSPGHQGKLLRRAKQIAEQLTKWIAQCIKLVIQYYI